MQEIQEQIQEQVQEQQVKLAIQRTEDINRIMKNKKLSYEKVF